MRHPFIVALILVAGVLLGGCEVYKGPATTVVAPAAGGVGTGVDAGAVDWSVQPDAMFVDSLRGTWGMTDEVVRVGSTTTMLWYLHLLAPDGGFSGVVISPLADVGYTGGRGYDLEVRGRGPVGIRWTVAGTATAGQVRYVGTVSPDGTRMQGTILGDLNVQMGTWTAVRQVSTRG